jgi:hypothetical protein
MDEEVPGIFMRIAGILPPKLPPVKMEVRNNIACIKSIYSVTGRKIAMAIDIWRPGIAPNNKPIKIPGIIINNATGLEKSWFKPSRADETSIMKERSTWAWDRVA